MEIYFEGRPPEPGVPPVIYSWPRSLGVMMARAGGTARVLIVDDDPVVLERAGGYLEGTGGYDCIRASSAEEALSLVGRIECAAVVSDEQMPGMNGIAFLRALRARGVTVPFVLYTGKSRDSVFEEAIDAGASFYVRKGGCTPAECAELLHAVRCAIALAGAPPIARHTADEWLALAVEGAGLAVWGYDLVTGEITYNRRWGEIIGPSGTVPKNDLAAWQARIHPDDREGVMDAIVEGIRRENAFSVEYRLRCDDGAWKWILSIGRAQRDDPAGQVSRVAGISQDVTARRRAEEALREANRKLNLLGSITRHDVLNQVTAIAGYTWLLLDTGSLSPFQRDTLGKIRDLVGMISREVEFTRLYADLGVMEPRWQHVGKVAARAAEGLDFRGITFSVATGDLEVFADPLFEKVLFNCFENALRHGGGVSRIEVSFVERETCGEIVVADDGVGVPFAQKKNIFARGIGQHTGFGLFLAKEVLDLTGIGIREGGMPGEGARFVLSVPKGAYRNP